MSFALILLTLISACLIHLIVKRIRAKDAEFSEDVTDDTFEYQLDPVPETNEPACYCDEPMENCNICDEVFMEELSLECDINNEVHKEEVRRKEARDNQFDLERDLDIIEKEVHEQTEEEENSQSFDDREIF